MLAATSTRRFGGSTLRTTIYLERLLRAHVIHRDRLLFDTRFSPPVKKSGGFVHLYASIDGTMEVGGTRRSGPQLWLLPENEFDRVQPGVRTFRSFGDPSRVVEIRMPGRELKCPAGIAHGAVDVPPAVWDAYRAFSEGTGSLVAVMDRLAAAKIVTPMLATSIVASEPEHFARLWDTLKPLYEQYATSASLKQISVLAGLSLRQLGRDLTDLTRTFGLFGDGFRDAMRVLRLRAAVLFLSSPDGTPTSVAREVGYGSLDAMARAFRDAKMPAPSVVQDAVRFTAA